MDSLPYIKDNTRFSYLRMLYR